MVFIIGLEGCTAAEQGEIDVLLQGLQSPAVAVRESVLAVRNFNLNIIILLTIIISV